MGTFLFKASLLLTWEQTLWEYKLLLLRPDSDEQYFMFNDMV